MIDEAARVLNMSPGGSINVAVQAALALEELEPGKTPARQLLVATASHDRIEFSYRLDAVTYFATKTADKTALKVLIAHVTHSNRQARSQAAHALARLGRAEAIHALVEDLHFDNRCVRIRAAIALGELDYPGVPHQRFRFPYLCEAARPIDKTDRHAKGYLANYVRGMRLIAGLQRPMWMTERRGRGSHAVVRGPIVMARAAR